MYSNHINMSKIPKKSLSFIGPGHTLEDELVIRSIKILDIGYVSVVYFVLAFIVSKAIDNMYGKFDPIEAKKKPRIYLYMNVIFHFFLLGITTYFARNIVELIPFPFDGVRGYDHYRLKELASASLFSVILVYYQTNLHAKLSYLSLPQTTETTETPQTPKTTQIAQEKQEKRDAINISSATAGSGQ